MKRRTHLLVFTLVFLLSAMLIVFAAATELIKVPCIYDCEEQKIKKSMVIPTSYDSNIIRSRVERKIYIIPYVGDIDGDVSEDWLFFFDAIASFFEENHIPASFSFYPTSLSEDPNFIEPFLKMYKGSYIKLMQKEYIDRDLEKEIEKMSSDKQIKIRKNILLEEQNKFRKAMERQEIYNVILPISYTQLGGRITTEDREALKQSGIKIYFDVYYNGDVGPLESTSDFDIIQYGISFTKDGGAGSETVFRTQAEIIDQINKYDRKDVNIARINEIPVIPLWVHQQDFERLDKKGEIDIEKWKVYTNTLLTLKNDQNVRFITANDVYYLKRTKNSNKLSLSKLGLE